MRVFKIVLRKTFLNNIFLKHFKRLKIFSAHERQRTRPWPPRTRPWAPRTRSNEIQARDHERLGRDHERPRRSSTVNRFRLLHSEVLFQVRPRASATYYRGRQLTPSKHSLTVEQYRARWCGAPKAVNSASRHHDIMASRHHLQKSSKTIKTIKKRNRSKNH